MYISTCNNSRGDTTRGMENELSGIDVSLYTTCKNNWNYKIFSARNVRTKSNKSFTYKLKNLSIYIQTRFSHSPNTHEAPFACIIILLYFFSLLFLIFIWSLLWKKKPIDSQQSICKAFLIIIVSSRALWI